MASLFTVVRMNISPTLTVPRHFASRRKLRFLLRYRYIYVDKKAPVHMRTAAQGLIRSAARASAVCSAIVLAV